MLKLNETEMRSVEGGAKATRYCSLYTSKKCAKKISVESGKVER